MQNLVALLGTFGWGTFAAAIVPSVGIGLNWKRATGLACTLSVATSLILNFALELAARYEIYTLPNGFAVGAFSLLAALVVFVGVSLATPLAKLPPDVEAAMEV
jgi:Na+/proline symporter